MSHRKFPAFVLLFLITSCAELPSTDNDLRNIQDSTDPAAHLHLLRQQGEQITGTRFMEGNKVVLLRDGAATYPSMLASIRAARHRIDMESFTFDENEGQQFASALLERSKAGVEVNLIYDAIGSDDTPATLFDRMRQGGIHVLEYNPIDAESIIDASINHRDHRKLLLIDGKIAFTGGLNISVVYRTKLKIQRLLHIQSDDLNPEQLPWRDTHIKIEGPVVAEFENLFMQTWYSKKGEPISAPPLTPTTYKGNLLVQAINGTPDLNEFSIYRSLLVSIALAQKYIYLTTAFFVPTPDLVHALERAAQRGVQVVIILPSRTYPDLPQKAGRAYYEDLMEAGVQIYERQNAVLHAKTAVIDGVWSTVGSSNLDWRSVLFNDECNAVILGNAFGQQMEALFQYDLTQSLYIDPQTWNDRPTLEKFDEWKARLVEYFL